MSALTETAAPLGPELVAQLLAGYQPLPGVYDEMMSDRGEVRAHWRALLADLAALGREELSRRFAAADRYLRDSGVFYRVYEDEAGVERAWPLTPVPLIIAADEWERLEAALIERAHLMEAVIADIYGAGTLFREKRLPGAFVAGSPEFLRPIVGVPPPGGAHLRIYAVDLGRGPDGRWWVLRDCTQAPSGAGFALENRLALRQSIPDIYRDLCVLRHAPFFQTLQAELTRLRRQDDSRVCVLTPGPMNETYFEHAYLARYLGFLLVEGEDLTVRDNGVFIRTVSGLKRTEVLLRRLDADFSDPLELNAHSRLGVPGLVQAVRDGKVVMANGLGSGIAEARAMLAFLPALCEAINGRALAMPNVATWWLGDPAVRTAMHDRFDDMVVAYAFTGEVSSGNIGDGVRGSELAPGRRQRIRQSIEERGIDVVLQEAVRLSTMPVWRNGKLEPRPFILRVFLVRHGESFAAMPGGFVRIGAPDDIYAISLQRGALTADAWIPSKAPFVETTLLPTPDRIQIQRASGTLPSRAADNLFWLGRYMERTEATLRLVRALLARLAETDRSEQDVEPIISLLRSWSAAPNDIAATRPAAIARSALQRGDLAGSAPALARAVRSAGSVIRDRLSPDTWRTLTQLAAACDAPLRGSSDLHRRLGAGARQGGAVRRLGHPRPPLARHVANFDAARRCLRRAASRFFRFRRRDGGAGGSRAAHHRVVLWARPGKHDPAGRLAVSRSRPPHRARHRDLPVRAPVRRSPRPRPRHPARTLRQPHHLSPALRDGRSARASDRSHCARPIQPPLRGVPVRADRKPSRRNAAHAARRQAVAAPADFHGDHRQAAHRGGGAG